MSPDSCDSPRGFIVCVQRDPWSRNLCLLHPNTIQGQNLGLYQLLLSHWLLVEEVGIYSLDISTAHTGGSAQQPPGTAIVCMAPQCT